MGEATTHYLVHLISFHRNVHVYYDLHFASGPKHAKSPARSAHTCARLHQPCRIHIAERPDNYRESCVHRSPLKWLDKP